MGWDYVKEYKQFEIKWQKYISIIKVDVYNPQTTNTNQISVTFCPELIISTLVSDILTRSY